MTRSGRLLVGACAALAASGAAFGATQREQRERGVVVGVSTSNGAPVTDMTARDFTVREDGVAREVLRVSPAPPPSHVALLVDDSEALQSHAPFVRSALKAFITRMGALDPPPLQALVTFGERPVRRADFSPNPDAALDEAMRLFPRMGSGAYFLQAIAEVSADLRRRDAASPILVAFVVESGPEFSTDLRSTLGGRLRAAGASLWTVTLQQGGQAMSAAERERAAVLGDLTVESGGLNRVVLSNQVLESAFRTLGELVASRYLVVYGRPESLVPPDRLDVTTTRRGVRVHAPRWAGR